MKFKNLGSTNIQVSPICLGANVFGWTIDEARSFEVLDHFVGAGFNFIDTADVYSRWASGVGGESETIIGKWMKARNNRSKIVLATKVGMDMGQGKTDVSKKYILKAVEDSLKRLQTDHIDLYQTHKDDEGTAVEEALEAYSILVKAGKVRCVGASNFTPERLKAALDASSKKGLPKYESLQPLYNLYNRAEYEAELEEICVKNNVGVISYYALAAGFLTGKYRSEADFGKSVRGKGANRFLNERGLKILKAMDEVAPRYNCELSTIALAWLLKRPSITAPIASATTVDQLKSILKAVEVNLGEADMRKLNEASSWK